MSARSLLLRLGLVTTAAASLGLDGGFRGCGGAERPPGGALPPGDPLECVVDSDCDAPMCQDATCVAGRCVLASAMIDADGDGVVGAPCGADCDDRNALVFPRAFEECDGIDNDCDTRVDEDAPARLVTYEVATEVLAASTIPTESGVLLISSEPVGDVFELQARWLDVGARGSFARTTIDTLGARPTSVIAISTATGAFVLWATAEHELRETTLTVTLTPSDATLTATPPISVLTGTEVVQMVGAPTVGGYAVLLDGLDPMDGSRRRLLVQPSTMPVPLPYTGATLDLAVRDSRLYTPASEAELAVLDPTGFELGRVRLPAPVSREAVAGWNGRILVVTEDAFDYALREITPADEVGASAPLFGVGDVQLDPVGASLAVTRDPGNGFLSLALYDEGLVLGDRYDGLVGSGTGRPVMRRWAQETSEGVVLTVVRDPSSSLVGVLGCRTP